mgnify:CR=1 FL=1|jgi:hypothetical protein
MKYDNDEQIIKAKLSTIKTPEYDIATEVNKKLEQKSSIINKRKPLRIAMLTCACLMLSVGVLAATVLSFNKIGSKVSPEIVPILQPIEMVSEDNGIKMEVVAAYNDDEMAVIYLTMQDLTGDRIDESIDLYNYTLSEGALFNSQVIDYDEETKTAILRIQANGGEKMDGKKLSFVVKSFLSGSLVFDEVETGINLTDIEDANSQTIPLNMEHVSGGSGTMFDLWEKQGTIQVLKGDEMNISLPQIDFMYISNIGYIDNKLHIQTKWVGDGIDDHGYFYFTDAENNALELYPSTVHFGIDESGNTMDRGDYIEYVFDLKGIDPKEVFLKGYFVSSGKYIEGNWETKFKLQSVNPEKETECKLDFGTWELDRIQVSQIGVTLLGIGKYDEENNPQIQVNMTDGTAQKMELSTSFSQNEKINLKYLSNAPLDSTMIESVNVDGKLINFKH